MIFLITVRRVFSSTLQHVETFRFQGLHTQKALDVNSDLTLSGISTFKDKDLKSILKQDVIFVNWIFGWAKMNRRLADGDTAVSSSKQIQRQLSMAFLGSEL